MNINLDKLRKPQFIFIIYVLISFLLILIFRFIFPGSEAPLPIYSRNWRFLQGLLDVFNLFPALAFSALVIPFGLASFEENYNSFSEVFFKRLLSSVITAIAAAIIYAFIFFFLLPVVKNQEENLRFSGEFYNLAKNNAYENAEAGDWDEASRFINICDNIWHNSPELSALRERININLEAQGYREYEERIRAQAAITRNMRDDGFAQTGFLLSENQDSVNATEAIAMSAAAYRDRRFFEAHWLANLGARLAPDGSAQEASAIRMASDAWNMIASQAPNPRERRLYDLHNKKLSGYTAMNMGNWIEAYYIFRELLLETPDDPDVVKFLAESEDNALKTAFFVDEIDLFVGEIINGALYSLPKDSGRAVLRFSTITKTLDIAYGMGLEYMAFDANNNLISKVISRYAKIFPFILNDEPQVLILTHALDRSYEEKAVKGEWLVGSETPGGILLDISFEDFLLISNVKRGLSNLQFVELFNVSAKLRSAGYIPQVFYAEILNRLSAALFFLPLAVFVIVITWRYRARTKPRYLFILLLPVLPIVFHGFVFLYRSVFNTLGIWLILSIGFIPALITLVVTFGLMLFISLIALSAQHG